MENITKLEEIDFYKAWLDGEGIPVIGGYYVEDVMKVPLEPWGRLGGLGTYLNLVGSDGSTGAYICEIPPAGTLKPEKHLFEEFIYILSGKGSTSIWNEGGPKQTFDWQEGTLFSPPLNSWHQLSNSQADRSVRLLAVTGAPVFMNLFHSPDFTFNNPFVFKERYAGESDYFSGEGKLIEISNAPIWETNFVKDLPSFELSSYEGYYVEDVMKVPLEPWQIGKGSRAIIFSLCQNTMEAHITEVAPGIYNKAHRHAGGAHILMISGRGYSLMWPEGQPKQRFDWHEGSIIVPPEGWFHQHFITGTKPNRRLALRWMGSRYRFGRRWGVSTDIQKWGDQIEYADEDPEIRRMFEKELAKEGLKSKMDHSLYERAV